MQDTHTALLGGDKTPRRPAPVLSARGACLEHDAPFSQLVSLLRHRTNREANLNVVFVLRVGGRVVQEPFERETVIGFIATIG